jgi:hypothetical protein
VRLAAAEHLERSADPGAQAIAALMLKQISTSGE